MPIRIELHQEPSVPDLSRWPVTREGDTITIGNGDSAHANLNPVYGSEQGGIRPVLILQNNIGNHYSPTLVVAPMTKRIEKKPYLSTHVTLNRIPDMKYKGNSLFMLEQLRAIDKRRMKGYIGKLTKKQMELIDQAARISLGLGGDAA